MKIEFLTENLEKNLTLLSKNISSSQQVPILSSILFNASEKGFTIQATNLELGAEVKVPAKIEEEGITAVPGKQFIEVVSSLPKDKISLEKKGETLHLSSRKNKVKFQTTPHDEFPTLFEDKGDKVAQYSKKDIEKLFSRIVFSTAAEDTRPVLTGILIKQFEDRLEYVTTDGFRLSRVTQEGGKIGERGDTLILPGKLVTEIIAQKKDKSDMYVNKSGHQIIFSSDDITLVGRMLHGDYPGYERVIPSTSSIKANINREEFLETLKISSVFARENSNIVKCSFTDNNLKISSIASSLGEQESEIDTEKEGEDVEISFNSKYLQDALRAFDKEQVTLEMSSPQDAVIFRQEEDENFIHVVMPVRM